MRRFWPLVALGLLVAACSSERGDQVGEVQEAVTCVTTFVEGVDVYDGNGTIDWTKVKAAGRDFAFMKATQGDYNTQKTFAANWSGSKAAGVLRSPYHFFDPTKDGVAQANYFLAELTAAGGLQPGDLPPMLDIECPTSSNQATADMGSGANCEYTGNSGWVATPTLVQRVFDWLTTVEQATGRKAIIYSYSSWFADVGLTDARLAQYPLFIATLACGTNSPPSSGPWPSADFFQYSWTGTVSGITGQVDMDRFIGDLGKLRGLGGAPDAGSDAAIGDAPAADARPAADGSPVAPPDASGVVPPDGGGQLMADASSSGGCSCRAARAPASPSWLAAAACALAIAWRRRAPRGAPSRRRRSAP